MSSVFLRNGLKNGKKGLVLNGYIVTNLHQRYNYMMFIFRGSAVGLGIKQSEVIDFSDARKKAVIQLLELSFSREITMPYSCLKVLLDAEREQRALCNLDKTHVVVFGIGGICLDSILFRDAIDAFVSVFEEGKEYDLRFFYNGKYDACKITCPSFHALAAFIMPFDISDESEPLLVLTPTISYTLTTDIDVSESRKK